MSSAYNYSQWNASAGQPAAATPAYPATASAESAYAAAYAAYQAQVAYPTPTTNAPYYAAAPATYVATPAATAPRAPQAAPLDSTQAYYQAAASQYASSQGASSTSYHIPQPPIPAPPIPHAPPQHETQPSAYGGYAAFGRDKTYTPAAPTPHSGPLSPNFGARAPPVRNPGPRDAPPPDPFRSGFGSSAGPRSGSDYGSGNSHDRDFGPRGGPGFVPRGGPDFGTGGSPNFGRRSSSDFGPRSGSDFGPRGGSDFGPRGGSDFRPRSGPRFGPRGGPDFGPRGGPDFGPRGRLDFGPRGGPGPFRQPGPTEIDGGSGRWGPGPHGRWDGPDRRSPGWDGPRGHSRWDGPGEPREGRFGRSRTPPREPWITPRGRDRGRRHDGKPPPLMDVAMGNRRKKERRDVRKPRKRQYSGSPSNDRNAKRHVDGDLNVTIPGGNKDNGDPSAAKFFCTLCRVLIKKGYEFQQHLRGRRHKQKVAEQKKDGNADGNEDESSYIVTAGTEMMVTDKDIALDKTLNLIPVDDPDKMRFYCIICRLTLLTEANKICHDSTPSHLRREKEVSDLAATATEGKVICRLCVVLYEESAKEEHVTSDAHEEALHWRMAVCDICTHKFNDVSSLEKHFLTSKHHKQYQKLQHVGMNPLSLTNYFEQQQTQLEQKRASFCLICTTCCGTAENLEVHSAIEDVYHTRMNKQAERANKDQFYCFCCVKYLNESERRLHGKSMRHKMAKDKCRTYTCEDCDEKFDEDRKLISHFTAKRHHRQVNRRKALQRWAVKKFVLDWKTKQLEASKLIIEDLSKRKIEEGAVIENVDTGETTNSNEKMDTGDDAKAAEDVDSTANAKTVGDAEPSTKDNADNDVDETSSGDTEAAGEKEATGEVEEKTGTEEKTVEKTGTEENSETVENADTANVHINVENDASADQAKNSGDGTAGPPAKAPSPLIDDNTIVMPVAGHYCTKCNQFYHFDVIPSEACIHVNKAKNITVPVAKNENARRGPEVKNKRGKRAGAQVKMRKPQRRRKNRGQMANQQRAGQQRAGQENADQQKPTAVDGQESADKNSLTVVKTEEKESVVKTISGSEAAPFAVPSSAAAAVAPSEKLGDAGSSADVKLA